MQIPDLTDRDQWTDDDLDALRVQVLTEQERRRTLTDAPAQVVALADRYAAGPIPWAVGQQVEVGDQRTHGGRVWTAKLAHITHSGWEPSASAYAVWTDAGPA